MTGEGKVSRRLVLGAAALLGGCTLGDGPEGAQGGSPGSSASGSAEPARPTHDPLWVRVENAKKGDSRWNLGRRADADELGGFCDRVSVLPGESVGLRISSALGPVTVSAHRMGWYAGVHGREVWRSPGVIDVGRQPPATTDELGVVTAPWEESVRVDTTGWPEGSYVFRIGVGSSACWTPLTVRTADPTGRLMLVNAVSTWQAYNQWGGHSLYKGPDDGFGTRSRGVSFDRPYDGSGAVRLMADEISTIRFVERLGFDIGYTTSTDLHSRPEAVAGAVGIVSLGHDEYWSVPMRRAVERARDSGSNVAFLGANACYWRIRLEDSAIGPHRRVVCYKSASEDPVHQSPEVTDLWRRGPSADPENSLTGMLYEAFPANGPMVVHDAGHWLLAGTGARRGDAFRGLNGIEVDRAYPVSGTPETLQVVMHSPIPAPGGRGMTHADMTYYTVPSGAGVVATGSMVFSKAFEEPLEEYDITKDSVTFARAVGQNLFTEMSRGPLGTRHPATSNLAALGASPDTRSGTGFAVDWGEVSRPASS